MQRTLKVKGMMCEHCEARVKQALEALPQVECATADHNTGLVVVELREPVDVKCMKKAVEAEDYKVLSIE